MFCERSSVSTSEDGVLSTIAGIVISSNGELGRVESGVVDTDPWWKKSKQKSIRIKNLLLFVIYHKNLIKIASK